MTYKPGDLTKGVVQRVVRTGLDAVDRVAEWWELPLPAQLLQLAHFREDLRRFNLYDTEQVENGGGVAVVAEPPRHRAYDGSQTDPDNPSMGKTGTRFGRNVPLEATLPEEQTMLDPSPREVANQLLSREGFQPATLPQRARGLLAAVPEPRLVQPRRQLRDRVHRGSAVRGGQLGRRDHGGPADEPRLDQLRRPAPAHVRQQGDAVVGRLAALRLHRGAQPGAALGRGRQAGDDRRRAPARGDQAGAARGRAHRLQRQLVGGPRGDAHAVRPRAQRDLRHAPRPPSELG